MLAKLFRVPDLANSPLYLERGMMSHEALPDGPELESLPKDGGSQFNRLVFESSPYLRQHAANPVDWYPWGDEAFARARELDRPIFLSVGYSTCHWCHVMERESFENKEIAQLLSDHFVAVKVDREERPDVDEIYMKSTQLMTGQGGWPNSVWLTPDRKPWYAGTYFPPEDLPGRNGFKTVLRHLDRVWREERAQVDEQADRLVEAVRGACGGGEEVDRKSDSVPGLPDVDRWLHELQRTFDRQYGGFGGAPKFPPHGTLRILLEIVAEEDTAQSPNQPQSNSEAREMLTRTVDALCRGGIHDQIGGGFHRYSTDREWLLPHFEKMLYDNAQLLAVLGRAAHQGIQGARTAAEGIVSWVEREMLSPEGGVYAALDADSEGVEGKCYLWTPEEVLAVLGEDRGRRFCRAYDISEDGNFVEEATRERPGSSVPRQLHTLEESAQALGVELADFQEELVQSRLELLAIRSERIAPHRDDKVVTSWAAMFAGALAEAGTLLGKSQWVTRAQEILRFLHRVHVVEGALHRSSRGEVLGPLGFLEDYAALGLACLDIESATGDAEWRSKARRCAAQITERFAHPTGGFYDAAEDHDHLILRPRDPFDPAMPSGNGLAAQLFHRLYILEEDPVDGQIVENSLRTFAEALQRAPRGTESLLEVVRSRALIDRPGAPEGGVVAVPWNHGSIQVRLSQLTVERGESVDVQLDGAFGVSGRWQNAQGDQGPAVTCVEATGLEWSETAREASMVRGTLQVPTHQEPGPTQVTLRWRGTPCRAELCMPEVDVEVAFAILVLDR